MAEPRLRDGRSWRFAAPVVACACDAQGDVAFALGDGTLRIAGAGQGQPRAVEAHQGAALALTTHPEAGFLSGGDDGRLVHTTGDGPRELLSLKGRWIENIAVSGESGLIACTAGKNAVIIDNGAPTTFIHASTAAGVAFDPK